MTIAVASGKGGTGKTTVSTALAISVNETKGNTLLVDCDVEEPNAHLFLKPSKENVHESTISVPALDETKCTLCGKCKDVCEYNAIMLLKNKLMIFEDMCHACGGCILACPNDALKEKEKSIGKIFYGQTKYGFPLLYGLLNVGDVLAPPLIRDVKKEANAQNVIIDSPPGTSCPFVTTIAKADYILLVTEATPSGLNDLEIAIDVVKETKRPFAVVVNRANTGYFGVRNFCKANKIETILEIPYSKEIAFAYSKGVPITDISSGYKEMFANLFKKIEGKVKND